MEGSSWRRMKHFWDAFLSVFAIDFAYARRVRLRRNDGIAGDWRRVGDDLRRVMGMEP